MYVSKEDPNQTNPCKLKRYLVKESILGIMIGELESEQGCRWKITDGGDGIEN